MASKWFLLMRPAPARAIRKFLLSLNSGRSPQLGALLPVFGPARLALLGILVRETLAALAHPAHPARRHADHQRVRGDVPGHHAAGADKRVFVERDAADDR